MRKTPVYIVCSPRPGVGKTLLARLLTEFLMAQHEGVQAFDVSIREPSLLDYLPDVTQTAEIDETQSQMALMDQIIANDGIPKVIDLGFHAFDGFFKMIAEIGFTKEAIRHGVEPIVLFVADSDRGSSRAWKLLRSRFPEMAAIPVENAHVLRTGLPETFDGRKPLAIAALPAFLKSIIDRTNFSFNGYLRTTQDSSSELYQWIRTNYLGFRELQLTLLLQKM